MTREEAEAIYGKIEIWITGGAGTNRIEAYFERYLDYDIPSWARGFGATTQEALEELLQRAEGHAVEDAARLLEHAILHNYNRCKTAAEYVDTTRENALLFCALNDLSDLMSL